MRVGVALGLDYTLLSLSQAKIDYAADPQEFSRVASKVETDKWLTHFCLLVFHTFSPPYLIGQA